uniref:Methyltransferase FkbM domain-containing protein n=1 Tax=Guillardia theta TaxID=55529 RepID=A0A7S4L7R1_GUITH|mmetsp:Transcript_39271/g.123835  ORF Transcript_39271/g.123835 Transcript_39271/m.123835 type:complete len:677 (+) Transcript_39271:102-2132(+)
MGELPARTSVVHGESEEVLSFPTTKKVLRLHGGARFKHVSCGRVVTLFLAVIHISFLSNVAAQGRPAPDVWVRRGSFAFMSNMTADALASQLCGLTSSPPHPRDKFGHFTFRAVAKHQPRAASASGPSEQALVELIWRQEEAGCASASSESSGNVELLDVRMEGRSRMIALLFAGQWPWPHIFYSSEASFNLKQSDVQQVDLYVCSGCAFQGFLFEYWSSLCQSQLQPFLASRYCTHKSSETRHSRPIREVAYTPFLLNQLSIPQRYFLSMNLVLDDSKEKWARRYMLRTMELHWDSPHLHQDPSYFLTLGYFLQQFAYLADSNILLLSFRALLTAKRLAPDLHEATLFSIPLFLMREDVEEAINLLESFRTNSPQHNIQVIPPLFSAIAGLRQAQQGKKVAIKEAAVQQFLSRMTSLSWLKDFSMAVVAAPQHTQGMRVVPESIVMGGCFGSDLLNGNVNVADPDEVELLLRRILYMLPTGDQEEKITFVDIGANTGCFSMLALGSPEIMVAAFEPIPNNYRVLLGNIAVNGVQNQIRAYNFGLWNESKTAEMCDMTETGLSGMSRISLDHDSHEGLLCHRLQPVQLMKLDDIVERDSITNVRLIKIDSEGSEMEILQGARNLLLRDRPEIFVEVDMAREADGDGPVSSFLTEMGYSIESRYGPSNLLFSPLLDT